MDRTLICINVFYNFSYHSQNLSKLSYESMFGKFENSTSLEHTFHSFFNIKIPHILCVTYHKLNGMQS